MFHRLTALIENLGRSWSKNWSLCFHFYYHLSSCYPSMDRCFSESSFPLIYCILTGLSKIFTISPVLKFEPEFKDWYGLRFGPQTKRKAYLIWKSQKKYIAGLQLPLLAIFSSLSVMKTCQVFIIIKVANNVPIASTKRSYHKDCNWNDLSRR